MKLTSKITSITFISALVLNAITWLVLWKYIPHTDNWIILQYNIYTGVSVTGEWQKVFYIAASGTVMMLLNTVLAAVLHKRDTILPLMLALNAIILQLVLLIAAALMIYINLM